MKPSIIPKWQCGSVDELMHIGHILPDASGVSGATSTFESVYGFMVGNVLASMVAYFIAQILDTVCILSILYLAGGLGDSIQSASALIGLMWSSYLFKFCFALLDTPLLYLGVHLYHRLEGSEKSGTMPGME